MVMLAALVGVVGLGGCGDDVPEPETPKQPKPEDVCAPGYYLCIHKCEDKGFGGLCFNCCKRRHLLCKFAGSYEFDECLE